MFIFLQGNAQEHANFIQLTPKFNNSNLAISFIEQDDLGYLWMSYSTGMLKYDGNSYINYSLPEIFGTEMWGDYFSKMSKDSNGQLWFVSRLGKVSKYSVEKGLMKVPCVESKKIHTIYTGERNFLASKTGVIYEYIEETKKLDSITTIPDIGGHIEFISISYSKSKKIFASTNLGRIYEYDFITDNIRTLEGPFSNFPGNIYTIVDQNENLWIGTETFGVHVYDIQKETFYREELFSSEYYNLKKEMIINLYCDSRGFVWACTDGGGLYRVNPISGAVELFTHYPNNRNSLGSNTIVNINEDNHQNTWILTNYGGVNILPKGNGNIWYHEGSDNNTPSRILSIHKSKNKDIWVGMDGTGVTRIVPNKDGSTKEYQYFNHDGHRKGFYVQSITEDDKGNIWLGTYKNGLRHYDLKTGQFSEIPIFNSQNHRASDIRKVYTDSKNRIWVGSNVSLNVYSSDKELVASFDNNSSGLKGFIAESMVEDQNGAIWVAYYLGGLFKFNEHETMINQSYFSEHDYYDVSIYDKDLKGITYMTKDSSGTMWIINNHGRLIRFNPNDYSYQEMSQIKAFNHSGFRGVEAENPDNLWLSSTKGLWHLNLKDSIAIIYNKKDGLQDNSFLPRSIYKDSDGLLYFGGIKGFNIINPKNMVKSETDAKLSINSIEVLNKSAKSLIPDQFPAGIHQVKNLDLEYSQSSFSFRFSAVDNVLDSEYYYAYRLKGFNDNWISASREQIATYTNIPAGSYTFEVKAGTKVGVWDVEPIQVIVSIGQPWWNRPLTYLIYALILFILAYGLRRWFLLKRKLFQEKVEHSKDRELHMMKMDFFAKLSHEIQTPLTLISGPIDNMLERAENNGNLLLKQRLQIISNNVKRLSRIVFELTTIRNKELERLRLIVTKNNMCKDLNRISLSFEEQARYKHIDFTYNCPKNVSDTWYDKDKMEHVVYNLLSNAFKFTPKDGNIQLNVSPINNKSSVKISISDSGPGIPKEDLESIFTLFYQSKSGKKEKGSGIGLALTKELIDLHRGKIEVISSATEGTTFTVTLPISEDAYKEEERVTTDEIPESKTPSEDFSIAETKEKKYGNKEKSILIVEDNFELQIFLKDLLSPYYNISLAENGEEGFYYAKSNIPDLILSDIMMPKLDGLEMCKRLQNEQLTKHIPVVLLTAKNSTNSKIEGLKLGAIEFINKPFNTNELLLKINNILASRELVISKFRKEVICNPDVNISKSLDDIFLENLVNAIHTKIENPNFKMEELADSLNMSYSALYRKCQTLTGLSLVDFVRNLRLKKAAIVIAKFGYTVSEAAYIAGFNDPKYFSKCFKKKYGKTPKTFKVEAQEIGFEAYLNKMNINNYELIEHIE